MKFAVTSASSVRGYKTTLRTAKPAETRAPATMHALMIDPLRNIADCEFIICKMFSSLLEQDQPERATEETKERRVNNR